MAWDFSTDPEFETKLDWMRTFVREEIMPLETLAERWRTPAGRVELAKIVAPMKEEVKRSGSVGGSPPAGHGRQRASAR